MAKMKIGKPLFLIACAMTAAAMLASCGAQNVPFTVLVVKPQDAAEISAVRKVIEEFAYRKQLRPSPPARSSEEWPELKQQQDRTLHYISNRGFYFTVYTDSPGCLIVKLVERKRDWTSQSLIGVIELQNSLMKIAGDRVQLATGPDKWRDVRAKMQDYCARK